MLHFYLLEQLAGKMERLRVGRYCVPPILSVPPPILSVCVRFLLSHMFSKFDFDTAKRKVDLLKE